MDPVHNEKLVSTPFCPNQSLFSKKYMVTIMTRYLLSDTERYELLFEVRSTADFSVVYSIKERALQVPMPSFFVDDICGVQIILETYEQFTRLVLTLLCYIFQITS